MRVFSFYVADVTVFQTLKLSLTLPLFEPFSNQNHFSLKPHHFHANILQNHFKVCFSKHCFHFSFNFVDFSLGLSKLGIFSKKGWVSQLLVLLQDLQT